MKTAVDNEIKNSDILIMSAAVADYKPKKIAKEKIKKDKKFGEIKLELTDDILGTLKSTGKIVVGFALETDNEQANALKKLKSKKLDMIVLNSLKDKESGFEFDTNKISVIHKNQKHIKFPLQSKFQAANKILSEVLKIKNN